MSIGELSIKSDRIESSIFEDYRPVVDVVVYVFDHVVLSILSSALVAYGIYGVRIGLPIIGTALIISGVALIVFCTLRSVKALEKAFKAYKETSESKHSVVNLLKQQPYTPTFANLKK